MLWLVVLLRAQRDVTGAMTAAERYETSLLVAAYRCLPPAFVFCAFMLWAFLSPSDLLGRAPRLVLWTVGISNAKLVTAIMLAHVCDEEYHPFSRTIACLCTLLVHVCVLLHWHRAGALPKWDVGVEDLMLWEAFIILFASYLHMIYAMIHEVSRALGIYAFTITKKRPVRGRRLPPPATSSRSPPRSTTSPVRSASPQKPADARRSPQKAKTKSA